MNRIFGKTKEKAPPPNLTDVISGVSDLSFYLFTIFNDYRYYFMVNLYLCNRWIVEPRI